MKIFYSITELFRIQKTSINSNNIDKEIEILEKLYNKYYA